MFVQCIGLVSNVENSNPGRNKDSKSLSTEGKGQTRSLTIIKEPQCRTSITSQGTTRGTWDRYSNIYYRNKLRRVTDEAKTVEKGQPWDYIHLITKI